MIGTQESLQNKRNKKIVRILVKDPNLVQQWNEFYDALDLTDPNIVQWRNGCNNCTLTTHDLFTNIIQSWQSRKGNAATVDSLCEALRSIRKESAAESLEREFSVSKSTQTNSLWPIWFNVGQLNRNFVGRQKELDQLQEIHATSCDKTIVISGLGGIGKTELTKKFSHSIYSKGNTSCTWFNGETEESLKQSLISLANKIGIGTENSPGKTIDTPKIFQNIAVSIYENSKSWLLVFDNVDEVNHDLISCLQILHETENNCMKIITSRNQKVATEETILIALEEWEPADAFEFVERSLQINSPYISELCEKFQNHPLGLQQAVAYIIQQQRHSAKGKSYSISDYLEEFETGGNKTCKLLEAKLSEISQKFAKTTFVTWDITINRIKNTQGNIGKLAAGVLHVISYMDPNRIDIAFLTKISKANTPSFNVFSRMKHLFIKGLKPKGNECFNEAIELLKAYSFIKVENFVITIHRLVQEVIRLKLKQTNKDVRLLNFLIEQISIGTCLSRSDITHVLTIWKFASSNENLIQKFPKIPNKIFQKLDDFILFSEMLQFATFNHQRLQEVLGPYHIETLNMEHNLALALRAKGQWVKSLEVYREVWTNKKSILGEKHNSTLSSATNLGAVLLNLQRYDESMEVWIRVLDMRKKTLGENHVDTITSKHNVARVFEKKKQFTIAMPLYSEVLEWRRKELGEEHPRTLNTIHNIGSCLLEQGKYSEANLVLKDVFKLRKKVLGEEHPFTLNSMFELGRTYYYLKEEEKALGILQQVLVLRKKVLGFEHPHTVQTDREINIIRMNSLNANSVEVNN